MTKLSAKICGRWLRRLMAFVALLWVWGQIELHMMTMNHRGLRPEITFFGPRTPSYLTTTYSVVCWGVPQQCVNQTGLDNHENDNLTAAVLRPKNDHPFIDATAILSGIAKNIDPKQIYSVVLKLRALGSKLERYHIVIYESNSKVAGSRDAWHRALETAWPNNGTTLQHSDYLFVSEDVTPMFTRTDQIAAARNRLLEHVQQLWNSTSFAYDYWILTDLDGVCGGSDLSLAYSPSVFKEALEVHSNKWDALSFIHVPYWDRWAFREKVVMPYSIHGPNSSENKITTPEAMEEWIESQAIQHISNLNNQLVEVDSAFMMMAIYRMNMTIGSEYNGRDETGRMDCEHVAFHRDMRGKHGARMRLWPLSYCQGDNGFQQRHELLDNVTDNIGVEFVSGSIPSSPVAPPPLVLNNITGGSGAVLALIRELRQRSNTAGSRFSLLAAST